MPTPYFHWVSQFAVLEHKKGQGEASAGCKIRTCTDSIPPQSLYYSMARSRRANDQTVLESAQPGANVKKIFIFPSTFGSRQSPS
jgi:hypothetical protein